VYTTIKKRRRRHNNECDKSFFFLDCNAMQCHTIP
jgi:hypothetical protein